MKVLLVILSMLFSLSSFAFMNDVECDGYTNANERIRVEILRSFGGSVRDALVTVGGTRGTNPIQTRHMIYSARRFGTRIEFFGDIAFRLEVDIWPDQAPRWGRTYRGVYTNAFGLNCRFPNAR
jgi:hypothetical protein